MSLIPGSSSAPSIHPNGIASGSVATPLPLLIPYGITGQIGNVRASSSTAQTLVNADNDIQIFTPTAAHDVNLPTTDVASGRAFYIVNRGGYALTIKSSGGNTVVSPSTGTVTNGVYLVRALQAAPTTAAHWMIEYVYETGTWSPTMTFATPGDLSVAYTANRYGSYTRLGNKISYQTTMQFTPTYTTASGNLLMSLPFTVGNYSPAKQGLATFQVLTKAGYDSLTVVPSTSTSNAIFVFYGLQGNSELVVTTTEITNGVQRLIYSSGFYFV